MSRADPVVARELAADGRIEREAPIEEDGCVIGCGAVEFDYPDESSMSERHARLRLVDDAGIQTITLEDLSSGSGVWLRLAGAEGEPVQVGDQLWLGAQILLLAEREDAAADDSWEVRHYGPDGKPRASHAIPESGLLVGRGSDLVLDPNDGLLSRRHLQLAFVDGELRVFDRGAHNGSFRKLRAAEEVTVGQEFRVGTRRFVLGVGNREAAPPGTDAEDGRAEPVVSRPGPGLGARLRKLARDQPREEHVVEAQSPVQAPVESSLPSESELAAEETTAALPPDPDAGERTVVTPPPAEASETLEEPPSPSAAHDVDRVLVVIDSEEGSVSLEVEPGRTVLEAVQEAGLERGHPVDWECGDGGCGVCIVGVLEGAGRMDPPDPATGEMKTIQITEQVAPDPKQYRLACLARVRGTVRLRKLT